MLLRCALVSLFTALSVSAQTPPTPPAPPAAPTIKIPQVKPPAPKPDVKPDVNPQPVVPMPMKLDADVVYAASFDQEFVIIASPEELVTITDQTGPVKMRAKFIEDPTATVWREFPEKFVKTVERAKDAPGGIVELLIFPAGTTNAKSVIRVKLDTGAPPPPVTPPVDPNPPKPVDPTPPKPASQFRALFFYESKNLKPQQSTLMNAEKVRSYLRDKCVMGADGKTPDARWYDKDEPMDGESDTVKKMVAAVRPDKIKDPAGYDAWVKTLPAVICFDGFKGDQIPLPDGANVNQNVADLLALLKRYGG